VGIGGHNFIYVCLYVSLAELSWLRCELLQMNAMERNRGPLLCQAYMCTTGLYGRLACVGGNKQQTAIEKHMKCSDRIKTVSDKTNYTKTASFKTKIVHE